jgi:hypothetical protein
MPSHPAFQGNPASGPTSRQPGYLFETRGFPSPSHKGFGFVVKLIGFLTIKISLQIFALYMYRHF